MTSAGIAEALDQDGRLPPDQADVTVSDARPPRSHAVAISSPSEVAGWVRAWVFALVALLSVVTVLTAFTEDMPETHHGAAIVAAAVMFAAWAVELSGLHWPRLLLVAATILPNVWLTLIGHISANDLFLLLLVAWVGVVGSRAEHILALGASLVAVAVGIGVQLLAGQVNWTTWISWTVGLLITWLMAQLARRQARLLAELSVLLTVSRSVASRLEMRPLLDAVLDALGSVVTYSGTAILTLNEAGDALTVAHWRGPATFTADVARRIRYPIEDFRPFWDQLARDEPIVIADIRGDAAEARAFRRLVGEDELDTTYAFIRSLMWVPLVVRGRIIGILSIANATPRAFDADDAVLALGIARQAAVAIENARLHDRARQAAILEERQRLARELHDSVTQSLYGISLYAEAAGRALAAGETAPVAANLREIGETTREALGETRLLLFELRPPLLEAQGLAAALQARLQAVEARAGLEVSFQCHGEQRLAPEKEQELFRLAQETLNNVLKHAHARRVDVCLELGANCAVLEVADDGAGFEPSVRGGGGFGLAGMRERAERVGGTLRIESSPGGGTRVRVEVPR
jgi:signal transduction histidine kinase